MLLANRRRALQEAKRAVSMLYEPVTPCPTNLWCIDGKYQLEIGKMGEYVLPSNTKFPSRNPAIYDMLNKRIAALDPRSVEAYIEMDYLRKYSKVRNWYFPESLRDAPKGVKWFLKGPVVPETTQVYLRRFWGKYADDFSFLPAEKVPCSRYKASAGVVLLYKNGLLQWDYCQKGPNWNYIQEGTKHWMVQVYLAVPRDWLRSPITQLYKKRCSALEKLALERPVIRTESGPGDVRRARSTDGNSYILGRCFIDKIQNGRWSSSREYLGKATNVQIAAIKRLKFAPRGAMEDTEQSEWLISTHGDDWVAWCPACQRWHSGDWSRFDKRIGARQVLASYQAWYDSIEHLLNKAEKVLFYAKAYLAIRTPTLWLWNKDGEPSLSVRSELGHVRSGSGEFVMAQNNALNRAALETLLTKTHKTLRRDGVYYPCRSKRFWKVFSQLALDLYGWIAKPSAQLTHPHGFVACRCTHTEIDAYSPRPSISSVVRNWVNPADDPQKFPDCTPLWGRVRFRDLNKTMAWAPKEVADLVTDCLTTVAMDVGVEDPYGLTISEAEMSRRIQQVVGMYSTSAYLSS